MKKMLVVLPLVLLKEQDIIRKAFIKDVIHVKRTYNYDIDFLITIKKEAKIYEQQGILDALRKEGINIINISSLMKGKEKAIAIDTDSLCVIDKPYDRIYVCGALRDTLKGFYNNIYDSCVFNSGEVRISNSYMFSLGLLKRVVPIFFVMKKHKSTVVQYIVDWTEFSFRMIEQNDSNIIQYGHYANVTNNWNCKHGYLYERFLIDKISDKTFDKNIDFIFGYTAKTSNRMYLSTEIERLSNEIALTNLSTKIYANDSYSKVNNTISQSAYMNKVANSKLSLIIPSYDKTQFSYMRMCECIFSKCLPIICCENSKFDSWKNSVKSIFEYNNLLDIYNFYIDNDLFFPISELTADKLISLLEKYDSLMDDAYNLLKRDLKL